MAERPNKRPTTPKTHQYDDWICLMCQNLNYSFRKTCNRCRVQTKENNDYLIEFYQASAYLALNYSEKQQAQKAQNPQKESSIYGEHSFPKCLFLQLNGDEEEETCLMRRESPEQETPRWINCLIGE